MQKLIIIGNVGNEPIVRATETGNIICSFNVATSKVVRGEKVTTWFKVATFSKLAEICKKHIVKGMKICVIGSITLNTYKNKDGQEKSSMEVSADEVEFLSPKEERSDADDTTYTAKDEKAGFVKVDMGDDLPF